MSRRAGRVPGLRRVRRRRDQLHTAPTAQQGGTALNANENDACLECHGQVPLDGTIEVDGERVPATIDVAGQPKSIYVNPDIQQNSKPRQAGVHQLPHRVQRRHAPGERHQGLAAHRQVRGVHRLPRRRSPHVRQLVPRRPHQDQPRHERAAVRRLPRRAQHRAAGHRVASASSRWRCAATATRTPRPPTSTATTARRTCSATRTRPSAASATGVTASCRPASRRAWSPGRTWSRPVPRATRAPTRTSPTSVRT